MESFCKYLNSFNITILAGFWLIKITKTERGIAMRCVEIITLRSPANLNTQFVDELLKGVRESDPPTDTPKHLVEIRIYHHSVVETDLSIHIYWKSEPGSQNKSPLGLRFSSALRKLGLLNHSVWVETAALELPLSYGNSKHRDIRAPDTKGNTIRAKPRVARKVRF
jgi:hypothetical protein